MPRLGSISPAAALSALGLVVAALVTLALLAGRWPGLGPTGGGGLGLLGGGAASPDPVLVVPAHRADVVGTILFAKAGNIWAASGGQVQRLTSAGRDTSPSWAADGTWIYFVETRVKEDVRFPTETGVARYYLRYPVVARMRADGTGREVVQDSLYTFGPDGGYTYHVWYLQPVPSPDGRTLAVISDAPDPFKSDLVLQQLPVTGGTPDRLAAPEVPPLGHADPAWRPDGKAVAFTHFGRSGDRPTPQVFLYSFEEQAAHALSGPGFSQPSWSPGGRYLAAVRAAGSRVDVVIIDATTGQEALALTNDGTSWAPTWSPRGDAIAFLHAAGQVVDLEMVTLTGAGAAFAVDRRLPITATSQVDGTSRPSWYVPPDLMPAPAASPSVSAGP